MSDKPPDILQFDSADERRVDLARQDYDTFCANSGEFYSKLYGKDPATICKDRKSDAYKKAFEGFERGRVKRIKGKGYKVIENVIDGYLLDCPDPPDGLDSKGYQGFYAYHSAKAERGARMVQWFFDRAKEIERITGDGTDSDTAALDVLRGLLAPDTTALQRENDELKQRIADIEARVADLNGIGKEILEGGTDDDTDDTNP